MNHWKQSTLALLGLSALFLTGCSQSQGPAGSAPGPNEADKAAEAVAPQSSAARGAAAQNAAAQSAAARGAAAQKAAAQGGASPAAGTP